MDAFSAEGAAEVWLKDDSAFAPHGGKARKLELLLADAQRRNAPSVFSGGTTASNCALATADFVSRELELPAVLVLVPEAEGQGSPGQLERMRATGAEVHVAGGRRRAQALVAALMLRDFRPPARRPYYVPPGASSPLGVLGYVQAGIELSDQVARGELPEPSQVVVALGTGGMAAGLLLGFMLGGLGTRVVAVPVSITVRNDRRRVLRLMRRTARLMARRFPPAPELSGLPDRLELVRYHDGRVRGPEAAREATELALVQEGLVLDPLYTSRTLAVLRELNAAGRFGAGPVLYWHTYAAPSA